MSFFRFIFLLCLISLLPAFALLYTGSLSGIKNINGGYAVLTLDSSINDKYIISLLENNNDNLFGDPVSESTQWVFLDSFGSIEKVPLNEYFLRVNTFDPRNDGYAEKVKNVFLIDGKRFIYIPLMTGNWNIASLNAVFKTLLPDIAFSIEYYAVGEPLTLFFIAYGVASVCFFMLFFIYKKTYYPAAAVLTIIPSLSSLALFGAPGIACSALILGFFFLFKEPFHDFAALKNIKFKIIQKEIIKPYRLYWYAIPVFIIAFINICLFSNIKVTFLLVVFAVSVLIFYFSAKLTQRMRQRRFCPVMIIKRHIPQFAFCILLIPFAAAVFFAIMFMPYTRVDNPTGYNGTIVEEQDYYSHLSFQSSFSMRQLGTGYLEFPEFTLDKDGLPVPLSVTGKNESVMLNDFPQFPLKNLMDFLKGVSTDTNLKRYGNIMAEKVSFLVLLLVIICGLIIKIKIDYSGKTSLAIKRIYSV